MRTRKIESESLDKAHRGTAGMERKYILTLLVVFVVGFSAFTVYEFRPSPKQQFLQAISQMTVGLDVKAYHSNGTLFAERNLPNDLIVDQFNKILVDMFDQGTGGSKQNPWIILLETDANPSGCAQAQGYCGLNFEIGTSGTAPARTDTALGSVYTPSGGNAHFPDTAINPVSTTTPSPATCNSGSTDSITGMSGSQTITSTATIQEAGAFLGTGAGENRMVFHDTFTGISVSNGDTVTVSYTLNLSNAGFTDNFCQLMAGLFTGDIATTGHVTITLTQTGGGTASFYVWCSSPPNHASVSTTACATTSTSAKIGIGTSNVAFTPTSLNLGAQVGSSTTVSGFAYLSPVAYWTTTITVVGSSNTIQEAAMFLSLSANSYMFFALTFTGQSQTNGVPFGFTIRVGD